MEIVERKLKGVFEITPAPHLDQRGFFMRTFDRQIFRNHGLERDWVQENHACSLKKGIIRGLHFQFPPHAETKLVRCVRGAILDVFVDLRKDSPTFGRWDSLELSEDNHKMVLMLRGLAHGYCTLTGQSDVLYRVDNYYCPEAEGGILWNDTELGIDWPVTNPLLSGKDLRNMSFSEFKRKYGAIDVNV
jgi:dTDP-4-dehydrorhamnose 3,5-epimerase